MSNLYCVNSALNYLFWSSSLSKLLVFLPLKGVLMTVFEALLNNEVTPPPPFLSKDLRWSPLLFDPFLYKVLGEDICFRKKEADSEITWWSVGRILLNDTLSWHSFSFDYSVTFLEDPESYRSIYCTLINESSILSSVSCWLVKRERPCPTSKQGCRLDSSEVPARDTLCLSRLLCGLLKTRVTDGMLGSVCAIFLSLLLLVLLYDDLSWDFLL